MRVGETCSYTPHSSAWSVLGAPLMKLSNDGEVISGEDVAVGIGATAAEKRENRIEELRRQVQNGSYKVDVHEVSKKIIDEHLTG
jgi:anti-sigma28 factor (negative regulator of flagellin synthesis)